MELLSFVRGDLICPTQSHYAKTYLSNMDQILTLIKLGTWFDNIWEQILTSSAIPTFNDIFAQSLCHLFTELGLDTLRFPKRLR